MKVINLKDAKKIKDVSCYKYKFSFDPTFTTCVMMTEKQAPCWFHRVTTRWILGIRWKKINN